MPHGSVLDTSLLHSFFFIRYHLERHVEFGQSSLDLIEKIAQQRLNVNELVHSAHIICRSVPVIGRRRRFLAAPERRHRVRVVESHEACAVRRMQRKGVLDSCRPPLGLRGPPDLEFDKVPTLVKMATAIKVEQEFERMLGRLWLHLSISYQDIDMNESSLHIRRNPKPRKFRNSRTPRGSNAAI